MYNKTVIVGQTGYFGDYGISIQLLVNFYDVIRSPEHGEEPYICSKIYEQSFSAEQSNVYPIID